MAEDLVLEQLRAMRNDFLMLRRDVQSGFRDMRSRLSSIEQHLAADAGDTAR